MNNTNDGLEVAMSALPETHHTGETSSFLPWQLNLPSPFSSPPVPEPQIHPLHITSRDTAAVDEAKLWRWIRLHPRVILFVMICLATCTAVLIPVVAVFSVKYKDANAKFEAAAFVVSYSNLTNGCTDNPGGTTGSTFISSYGDGAIYTMYCNKDTAPPSMFSLFAGSFNSCMESCTVWNLWRQNKDYSYPKCQAVTFVPYWANIAIAADGGWTGDCWLKTEPFSFANLSKVTIGTECHSAIAQS